MQSEMMPYLIFVEGTILWLKIKMGGKEKSMWGRLSLCHILNFKSYDLLGPSGAGLAGALDEE